MTTSAVPMVELDAETLAELAELAPRCEVRIDHGPECGARAEWAVRGVTLCGQSFFLACTPHMKLARVRPWRCQQCGVVALPREVHWDRL